MRILLVNQTYYPDKSATAQYLTDLAEFLAEKGDDVEVLTSSYGYVERARFCRKEIRKQVKISRVGIFSLGRETFIRRVIDSLFLNFTMFLRLLLWRRVDRVVFMTSPPLLGVIVVLALRWRVPGLIFWVMDINPEQAARAGLISPTSMIYRTLDLCSRFVVSSVDRIIVLDRFMQSLMEEKGAGHDVVQVLPLWPGEDNLRLVEHAENNFRRSQGWQDKFVVMLSGNFSICHPLETILDAAREMSGEKEFIFAFIGGGARQAEIESYVNQYALNNLVLLPYQSRDSLSESLSAADLHVISMGSDYVGLVHPSKVYGVLALQRPFVLVGPMESSVGDLVRKFGTGYQVDHGDVYGLCRVIRQVRNEPPLCAAATEFSRDVLLNQTRSCILS